MIKILLDTDIGGDIDDAVCLAYLLKEPRCRLLGITTVCGEPEKRAAVADAICKAAGRRVPIAAGLDATLQPVPVYPTPEGAGALERWPHGDFPPGDAPGFLYRMIRENPREAVLVAIGNMTNVAVLFRRYPDAPGLLRGLYVMNGYFGAEPLPDPTWNWNSWADPLASREVFAADVPVHRAFPLEVTEQLTIPARRAGELLRADTPLMRAVFDFGNAWLESAGKLTLHDPLAAVAVFHPEVCTYERGAVRVETEAPDAMGGTSFTPCPGGKVEVARTVDREAFYRILSETLNGGRGAPRHRERPPAVEGRARSAGEAGKAWLERLDQTVAELEAQWNVAAGEALPGGSHALVAPADGENGERYVLKLDMPEGLGGEFSRGVAALRLANGRGYAKLYAYDEGRQACLLERLGKPLSALGLPVGEQLEILCGVLRESWEIPVTDRVFPEGGDSVAWFRDFLPDAWETLRRPCSRQVLDRAFRYLDARERALDPSEWVLVHGDAHAGNVLQSPEGGFRMVDPDGIFYEKAYDLGVLMREWPEEYREDPLRKGRERGELLHRLTGAPAQAIWEWGFLQTVSTAFVLIRTGRQAEGSALLSVAERWTEGL